MFSHLREVTRKRKREGGDNDDAQRDSVARKSDLGLRVLAAPKEDTEAVVDIVMVHGLTGSIGSTWLHENSGVYWPTTIFSRDLPAARILAFGYDADIVNFWNPASQSRIGNHAETLLGDLSHLREDTDTVGKVSEMLETSNQCGSQENRKIIFIAHSLGGLVTENALIIADNSAEKHIRQVGLCAAAIAFLGTPQAGSDLTAWGQVGLRVTSLMKQTNSDLVAVLKPGSEMLAAIQKGFHNVLRRRKDDGDEVSITSFYEELPVAGLGEIVPKHSAVLPQYASYSIHANHMDMTKFSASNNAGYKRVLGETRRWIKDISGHSLTDKGKKEREDCLKCIYSSDYKAHKKRNPDRAPDTCQWFLEHDKYRKWRQNPKSDILWVSGDPGCGKSVLASFIVDELGGQVSQQPSLDKVCFFFFKDDNDEQKSSISCLRAILHQLFVAQPALVHHALNEYRSKGQKFVEELHTLWDILTAVTADATCGNIICVVDGLDECEEHTRKDFLREMVDYYSTPSHDQNCLKVLALSRPYLPIQDEFENLQEVRLKTEDELDSIGNDIELVVKHKIENLSKKRRFDEKFQNDLTSRLIRNSDKTFLWVSLVLDEMEKTLRTSQSALENLIDTMPSSLNEIYEKILSRSPCPEDAREILHIIVGAVRPLTLSEMNIAFSIKPTDRTLKDISLEPSIGDTVKNLCGMFVRIIDSRVYLVHQTAREFLVREEAEVTRKVTKVVGKWKYSLAPSDSHFILAERCVRYLSIIEFSSDYWKTRIFPTIPDDFGGNSEANSLWLKLVLSEAHYECRNYHCDLALAMRAYLPLKKTPPFQAHGFLPCDYVHYIDQDSFLLYAARQWPTHLRETRIEGQSSLYTLVSELCAVTLKHSAWFKWWWGENRRLDDKDWKIAPEGLTTLMVASMLGIESLVKFELREGAQLESRDSDGFSALSWAVWFDHASTARALLKAGADINLHLGEANPLFIAATKGLVDTGKMLLEAGANIECEHFGGETPLLRSLRAGHREMASMLLEAGASTHARQANKDTALYFATVQGFVDVAQTLLTKGASPDCKDTLGDTPLMYAVSNQTMTRLLLDHGANINDQSETRDTPLLMALKAYWKNENVVRLLLDRGADINLKNAHGDSPLSVVIEGGWGLTFVKLLIEKGADIEIKDGSGRSPLFAAVSNCVHIMQYLLDRGADASSKDDKGDTPLHLALRKGHLDMAGLLIDRGADIKSKGHLRNTPLHVAAKEGLQDPVQLLLEKGADLCERNILEETPLHLALQERHPDTARLLLEKGAEVKSKDSRRNTPLYRAAKE
ncbi:MAG: hypothetical protein Q9160_008301 [Pyrenula sp. 1 TL-2023]